MLVRFMADQIIRHPQRYIFSEMPNSLKAGIAEVLIERDAAHLIDEEEYRRGLEDVQVSHAPESD